MLLAGEAALAISATEKVGRWDETNIALVVLSQQVLPEQRPGQATLWAHKDNPKGGPGGYVPAPGSRAAATGASIPEPSSPSAPSLPLPCSSDSLPEASTGIAEPGIECMQHLPIVPRSAAGRAAASACINSPSASPPLSGSLLSSSELLSEPPPSAPCV